MKPEHQERLEALAALRSQLKTRAARVESQIGPEVERYRREISKGVTEALQQLCADVTELTDSNAFSLDLVDRTGDYVDWLQWTFWDLSYFAVAQRSDPKEVRRAVASCGLTYLSARIVDDLLDRHFLYRGKRETLLASLAKNPATAAKSEGLAILGALLISFEGLSRLCGDLDASPAGSDEEARAARRLAEVIGSMRKTVIGAVMEGSDAATWDRAYYDRLIALKNVDYWRTLYAAIDPEHASPLYPFLVRYYTLAQKLNDVQGHSRDEQYGQPNLLTILREEAHSPGSETNVGNGVNNELAADFLELAAKATELPEIERGIAEFKLCESLEEGYRLGLFVLSAAHLDEPGAAESPSTESPVAGLDWDSEYGRFIERLGGDCVEATRCPVCRCDGGIELFRKQGFRFVRCQDCTHIYVSPRLRADVYAKLADELDGGSDDPFMEVQKIYAGYICGLLARHATGTRLLDVGFGRGYLMHVARAQGFEVYGAETSREHIRKLYPVFGERLHHAQYDESRLPWGSFDVVVMSHVLEHIPDLRRMLASLREAIKPDGLLYVAVPDMESTQFRVFGKRWDVVNPLVHLQYFCEDSLRQTLSDGGFEVMARVEPPPVQSSRALGWMRLFRELGGTETGELAVLARRA